MCGLLAVRICCFHRVSYFTRLSWTISAACWYGDEEISGDVGDVHLPAGVILRLSDVR